MGKFFTGKHPSRVVAIDLAIITECAPVLHIDEVRILQRFILVMDDRCASGELFVEFIVLRMCDDEVCTAPCVHPLCEAVRHALRQRLDMGSPGEYDPWSAAGEFGIFVYAFPYGDDIGQALERMQCRALQAQHGYACESDELVDV